MKIKDGNYKLTLQEPITVECSLFLIQCLQHDEVDRISIDEIQKHPFVSADMQERNLTKIKIGEF